MKPQCQCASCRAIAELIGPTKTTFTFADLDTMELPCPPFPTDAWPGSKLKKRIMKKRVQSGFAPIHPDDLTFRQGAMIAAFHET